MKQRIISAAVGLLILFAVLFFYTGPVLNVAVALVGMLGVFELYMSEGYHKKHRFAVAVGLCYAALVPFFSMLSGMREMVTMGAVFVLFGTFLAQHATLRLEELATIFMGAVMIPYSLSCLVLIRNQFVGVNGTLTLFYILLALGAAWLADSGAYFAGRFFGKHKMSPVVSPHKTVEGAVGGVVTDAAGFALLGFLFQKIMEAQGTPCSVNYIALAVCGALCALIGMLGDLSASVIKRQQGVKDFGTIMPGHGGVLDRFDSVLFVVPFFYLVLQVVRFVTL